MKFIKKLLVLTVSLFTFASLASCGKGGETVDYSSLTFEDVFEIIDMRDTGITDVNRAYVPGLTLQQLTATNANNGHEKVRNFNFYLSPKYNVKLNSISFKIDFGDDSPTVTGHFKVLDSNSKELINQFYRITKDMNKTLSKTESISPAATINKGSKIKIYEYVSAYGGGAQDSVLYNFSIDFEVLGK